MAAWKKQVGESNPCRIPGLVQDDVIDLTILKKKVNVAQVPTHAADFS